MFGMKPKELEKLMCIVGLILCTVGIAFAIGFGFLKRIESGWVGAVVGGFAFFILNFYFLIRYRTLKEELENEQDKSQGGKKKEERE